MIASFEKPGHGDIRIKDSSVLNTPPKKRNVKMVFQPLAVLVTRHDCRGYRYLSGVVRELQYHAVSGRFRRTTEHHTVRCTIACTSQVNAGDR
jgi:hypothetical protein